MDVTQALESRYTVRAFTAGQPDRKIITAILEAALRTPSWANTQPWEIFVAGGDVLEELRRSSLDNLRRGATPQSELPRPQSWPEEHQRRMRELMTSRYQKLGMDPEDEEARRRNFEQNYSFFGAPVVAYLCIDKTLTSWSVFDLGMMAQSIMLAAQERGIGSAIAYNLVTYPELIRAALDIPEKLSIIIGIAMGYADSSQPTNSFRSPRRTLDDAVRLRGL